MPKGRQLYYTQVWRDMQGTTQRDATSASSKVSPTSHCRSIRLHTWSRSVKLRVTSCNSNPCLNPISQLPLPICGRTNVCAQQLNSGGNFRSLRRGVVFHFKWFSRKTSCLFAFLLTVMEGNKVELGSFGIPLGLTWGHNWTMLTDSEAIIIFRGC